jgi:hypothetical protein
MRQIIGKEARGDELSDVGRYQKYLLFCDTFVSQTKVDGANAVSRDELEHCSEGAKGVISV